MVDSCVGGKSSINVGPYKNIAGNFYPPDLVCIDTVFCSSLPRLQVLEGLCEAVKICFASTDDSLERYLSLANPLPKNTDSKALKDVIALTLSAKKRFIEKDEFDEGVRLLLNFGHTFGHALEGASHYRISHGIAVGLGMLAAAFLSVSIGLMPADQPRTLKLLRYTRKVLNEVPYLSEVCRQINLNECLHRFSSDKKHQPDKYQVIAIDSNGQLIRHEIVRTMSVDVQVRAAFEAILGEISEIQ